LHRVLHGHSFMGGIVVEDDVDLLFLRLIG